MKKIIAPSILSSDFANLGSEIGRVTEAGADWIHVDVMDGHFVPNLTIGAPVVAAMKKVSSLPLDVHLMISDPEFYLESFLKAGSDILTVHIEALQDPRKTFARIRAAGAKAGLTLKPGTPIEKVLPWLGDIDLLLVMTVEPGFGGQAFMEDQIVKISQLAEARRRARLSFFIEVDGGITDVTVRQCHEADAFVAGNYIFKNDLATAISTLRANSVSRSV